MLQNMRYKIKTFMLNKNSIFYSPPFICVWFSKEKLYLYFCREKGMAEFDEINLHIYKCTSLKN